MKTKPDSVMVTWQTPETIQEFNRVYNAPYGEPVAEGEENVIYSKHCQLGHNTRQTGLNNHVMIIGGPGTGKSYNVIQPNLLQGHDSYVVLDICGELLATTGKFFKSQGYDIRVLNFMDVTHSNHYNPFFYLRNREDVDTLIECLFANCGRNTKENDTFFAQAEKSLLKAVLFYLIRYQKPEKQNFMEVYHIFQKAADQRRMLDFIFDEVRERNAEDICVEYYDQFKMTPVQTAQTILFSLLNMLAPLNTEPLKILTTSDDIDLQSIGDKKTITYIVMPAGPNPYAFLVSTLYSQIFDTLCYHTTHECEEEHLKYDVCFLMDEFANICAIPRFVKTLSVVGQYGISCMIFLHAIEQLANLYPDSWENIIQNCDTLMYLGGYEVYTMEDLLRRLNSINFCEDDRTSALKEPVTVKTIGKLKRDHCVVLIKGNSPFYDEKYDTATHPNIGHMGDIHDSASLYNG